MNIAKVCVQCTFMHDSAMGWMCCRPIKMPAIQSKYDGEVFPEREEMLIDTVTRERTGGECGEEGKFFSLAKNRIPKEEFDKLGWWKRRGKKPIIEQVATLT